MPVRYQKSKREATREARKAADAAYCKAAQAGNAKAANEMVKRHRPFALRLIAGWHRQGEYYYDIEQAALLGLNHAVMTFDWNLGFAFIVHAQWWIKAYITKEIAQSSTLIRIPDNQRLLVNLGKKKLDRGARPTPKEADAMQRANAVGVSKAMVPVNAGDVLVPVLEVLPDQSPLQDEALEARDQAMRVMDLISMLPHQRDRLVIAGRFGLQTGVPRTLQEIGEELGVHRERVRQIERTALARLRNIVKRGDAPITGEFPRI